MAKLGECRIKRGLGTEFSTISVEEFKNRFIMTSALDRALAMPPYSLSVNYQPGWGAYEEQVARLQEVVDWRRSVMRLSKLQEKWTPWYLKVPQIEAVCDMSEGDMMWFDDEIHLNTAQLHGLEKVRRGCLICHRVLSAYSVSSIRANLFEADGLSKVGLLRQYRAALGEQNRRHRSPQSLFEYY